MAMLEKLLDIFKLSGLLGSVKGYIESKIRLYVLETENKIARVLAGVILLVTAIVLFFVGFVFLGIGLSLLMNEWLDSRYLGFLIMGGFFFLVMIAFVRNIDGGSIHRSIKRMIVQLMENKD